jgi:hypothetical protein
MISVGSVFAGTLNLAPGQDDPIVGTAEWGRSAIRRKAIVRGAKFAGRPPGSLLNKAPSL